MRPIKFRVWDSKDKIIREKIDGRYWMGMEVETGNLVSIVEGEILDVPKNRFILMQFTGLYDKNGEEIWEGDILNNEKEEQIMVIRFDISGGGWQFDEILGHDDGFGRGDWRFTIGISKNCNVIGNIHENPELLNTP